MMGFTVWFLLVGFEMPLCHVVCPAHFSTWMRQEFDAMPVEVGVTKRLGVRMLIQPAVSGE
jgi:hypothetical protein